MKRILLIFTCLILTTQFAFAEFHSLDGGVQGDPTSSSGTYLYEEMLFITGTPIKLSGTIKVPKDPTVGNTNYSLTYKYTLANSDGTVTLDRSVTYDITKNVNTSYNQTQYKAQISKITEEIDVDGVTYTLDGQLFTESLLYDNTPAVDYYAGTIYSKRNYYIDGTATDNSGKVEIETTGDTIIGYDHYWGSSDTNVLNQSIKVVKDNPNYDAEDSTSDEFITWNGQAILRLSKTERKDFEYIINAPQTMSFRSGYIKNHSEENILQYEYNLPRFDTDGLPLSRRNTGESSLRQDLILDSDSLLSPKFRDIGGHWAEETIFLLASLNIFDNDSSYFSPDTPITRIDFARAIANSLDEVGTLTRSEQIVLARDEENKRIFEDITLDNPDYSYVKFVKDKGIMAGENGYFLPDRTIRRSEAIQIMVNALGITHLAPSPPYQTGYVDDANIPTWAKDAIYMANEIGLVTGYQDGYIRPNELVTRSEAATMVYQFIEHIRNEINYDYREKIINR